MFNLDLRSFRRRRWDISSPLWPLESSAKAKRVPWASKKGLKSAPQGSYVQRDCPWIPSLKALGANKVETLGSKASAFSLLRNAC